MTDATMTAASACGTVTMAIAASSGSSVVLRLVIGIDLGDRHSHVCVLDGDGAVVEESRLQSRPDALRQRFRRAPRTER